MCHQFGLSCGREAAEFALCGRRLDYAKFRWSGPRAVEATAHLSAQIGVPGSILPGPPGGMEPRRGPAVCRPSWWSSASCAAEWSSPGSGSTCTVVFFRSSAFAVSRFASAPGCGVCAHPLSVMCDTTWRCPMSATGSKLWSVASDSSSAPMASRRATTVAVSPGALAM